MIAKSHRWHKTAVAAAAIALLGLSSTGAWALSLGRITVQSALGEPLRAEIEIPDINAEEAASLKAGVAPPSAFSAAGIEYNTAMAGCAGISGSTKIGKNCMIAGGVGMVGHIEVCDNVFVTGMTMVTRSITEPGSYSSGTAMQPAAEWRKSAARIRQLDDMARRLQQLEKQLAAVTSAADTSSDA